MSPGEVELAVERIYTWAAWADKYDGLVHHTPYRNVTLAMPEPIGVLGIVCPDEPSLLGLVSAVMPAIAMGNTVVVIPSPVAPLAATDFYQVLDTSDLPGGVVNIVTGPRDELSLGARGPRRRRRHLVLRRGRGLGGSGAAVERQHEADLGEPRA